MTMKSKAMTKVGHCREWNGGKDFRDFPRNCSVQQVHVLLPDSDSGGILAGIARQRACISCLGLADDGEFPIRLQNDRFDITDGPETALPDRAAELVFRDPLLPHRVSLKVALVEQKRR